jgi:cytochrome c biogenesis protein
LNIATRAWRELRKMRTAIILLVILALLATIGTLLPQLPQNPRSVMGYVMHHPTTAPWFAASACSTSSAPGRSSSSPS